jgi:nucleoside-diphosphate-sugar epimerase
LLKLGHTVKGIDHLEQATDRSIKENNLKSALQHPNFHWQSVDLLNANVEQLVADVDVIFHLAGLAGVRNSWGVSFTDYLQANVLLTQKILEACRKATKLKKLVYASSSSVYGGGNDHYSSEQSPTLPISPYGLTKLAGEQLCALYHKQYGLPYSALRYFTVFGPRQRPDMGFHRFMKAAYLDHSLTVYGNGEQTRDFTYVSDVVEANINAMSYSKHGNVFNIGGVERASVNEIIQNIKLLSGKQLQLVYLPEQPGDPFATGADISLARAELRYNPIVSLDEGMSKQWSYITKLYGNV